MAISPKKLGAYMEAQDADFDEVEVETPEMESEESEEHEAEESEEHEALEHFLTMLMENGALIESAAHQVELFSGEQELDEDTAEQLEATLESLPEDLKAGMAKFIAGLSMDDLHELLEQLEEVEAIENDAVVVPYLFHAARHLAKGESAEA